MPSVNFTAAADELRQQEIARLADAVVPRLEALRAMTPATFRTVIAAMLERFGHQLVTDPAASSDLVTTKEGRKFITVCARPGPNRNARSCPPASRRHRCQCAARIFHHRAQLHTQLEQFRGFWALKMAEMLGFAAAAPAVRC
jgi:hypothetical protein